MDLQKKYPIDLCPCVSAPPPPPRQPAVVEDNDRQQEDRTEGRGSDQAAGDEQQQQDVPADQNGNGHRVSEARESLDRFPGRKPPPSDLKPATSGVRKDGRGTREEAEETLQSRVGVRGS